MFFKISIVYIEDSPLYFEDYALYREENIKLMTDLCDKYGFNLNILTIENIFETNIKNIDNKDLTNTNKDHIEKLKLLLKYFSNNGDFYADLINILKQNFIFSFALKNTFTKVTN